MVAQKGHIESAPASASAPAPAPAPTFTSCRKNKSENASFVADLKDHFTEFIHRPMDEHKICIKSTYHKVIFFGHFHLRFLLLIVYIANASC